MVCGKVDERMLRYVVLKRRLFKPMPSTYKVAQKAARHIHKQQWERVEEGRRKGQPVWWDPEVRQ